MIEISSKLALGPKIFSTACAKAAILFGICSFLMLKFFSKRK